MNKNKSILVFVLSLVSSFALAQEIQNDCRRDLEHLPRFLLANDAGGADHMQRRGSMHFEKALEAARQAIAGARTEADCETILDNYLESWRPDHLNINSIGVAGADSASQAPKLAPSLKMLSKQTLLISIPSFNSRFRGAITELLESNANALGKHENWIIDVRRNSGGSDSSFAPLLPWLLADEYVEVGVEFLVTERNFEATKHVCERYAPGDEACLAMINPLLRRMRVSNHGDFVPLNDSLITFKKETDLPKRRPRKVAVLVDKYCGSSCEQFLLAARQSFSVKLIGRNTAGALDYSNLRPYLLPSGKRELMYSTSRSARLPLMPVDAAGIMPDIYLPPPKDDEAYAEEIMQVKEWLEGGSLAAR